MRIAVLAALLFIATPALAAAPPAHPVPRAAATDALFAQLAKADSAEAAQPIEKQILERFLHAGGDTADVLMARAAQALSAGDAELGTKLLDAVTDVVPNYAEGWHQRARLQAGKGDDQAAIASLQRAVALNPRQFEALTELAGMLEEYGDKPAALELYRRVLALDPHYEAAASRVRELERAVEGQRI